MNNFYIRDEIYREFVNVKPINIINTLVRHKTKVYKERTRKQIKRIVIHTTNWIITPEDLAEYDIGPNHISSTGNPGITYHEMINTYGDKLFQTLDWSEVAWHVGIWNPGSLAIALIFKVSNRAGVDSFAPHPDALKTLQSRCGDICLELGLTPDRVVGHRELKGTGWFWSKGSRRLRKTCPGLKVNLDLLRTNVAKYMQIKLFTGGFYRGGIDGLFGRKSKSALKRYRKVQ